MFIRSDRQSSQERAPTCFICFNVEEKDVGKWLEHTLVPDLDKTGVKPLFCFRDLGPGKELNNFQGAIRNADQVIIICTPDLKQKCDKRIKAPIGVALEIRLAQRDYSMTLINMKPFSLFILRAIGNHPVHRSFLNLFLAPSLLS